MVRAIARELDRIAAKGERQGWRRHFQAKKDLDKVMKCYQRIQGHLERLNVGIPPLTRLTFPAYRRSA